MLTPAMVLDALRAVQDPDLHQDIVALGFVHDLVIEDEAVRFEVRLTTPACPAKAALHDASVAAVASIAGRRTVSVKMTAAVRAPAREEAEGQLRDVRHVVAVVSGKGGVGKSTTAVNLAVALADTGARVGLLDMDIQGPSIQHLTGVGVPEDLAHEGAVPPEHAGVRVLSMAMFLTAKRPALLRGPRVTAIVQQFLTTFAWGELDYLIVDTPPGTGDVHITLAQTARLSGAVLVTTPQETALLDTRRSVTMLRQLGVPVLGVVETMAGFVCPDCDVLHPIFGQGGGDRLAAELDVPVLGRIPLDPAVVLGGERAEPVARAAPSSPAGAAYVRAAHALAAALSTAHHAGGPPAG